MRDQKRDEEFKGLMEGVIDSLNKSIDEDDLWWKKNGEKVRENTLKERKKERKTTKNLQNRFFSHRNSDTFIGSIFLYVWRSKISNNQFE